MTFTDITDTFFTVAILVVALATLVALVERAHRRAQASGRSLRGFPSDIDDADARRLAAELRARAAETAPRPQLRGRRHTWVNGAR